MSDQGWSTRYVVCPIRFARDPGDEGKHCEADGEGTEQNDCLAPANCLIALLSNAPIAFTAWTERSMLVPAKTGLIRDARMIAD
jgi:hypothetical protein